MALEATGVHLGFSGDQLLDHTAMAFPSCRMQGRLASTVQMWTQEEAELLDCYLKLQPGSKIVALRMGGVRPFAHRKTMKNKA